MSFGTSISRDFIWRILMLPSIPLAVTTSQASSYMVFESSQAYTSAAPAFLAHMLHTENRKSQQEHECIKTNLLSYLTYRYNTHTPWLIQIYKKVSKSHPRIPVPVPISSTVLQPLWTAFWMACWYFLFLPWSLSIKKCQRSTSQLATR